jgi:hypothetical protein
VVDSADARARSTPTRGCDHDSHRRFVRARGITPVIARRGTAHGSNLGTLRWVNARPTRSLCRRRDESTRQTTPLIG